MSVDSVYIGLHKVKRKNALQRYGHLKFSKWLPAAILDLIQPETAPFDPPSLKTHPRTKHEVDRVTHFTVMAI